MKNIILVSILFCLYTGLIHAQNSQPNNTALEDIHALIDSYSLARENKDTLLLNRILVKDIDQLVSSGEWRYGKIEATKGMLKSSTTNQGTRKITVEKIRFFNLETAIVDTRYEIQNTDGTTRKMWSTFIVVYMDTIWKIAAIRNMFPSR